MRLANGIDGNTFSATGDTLRIGGIVDTSTVDWYGNVTLMIFAAGCNFRCPYCQNSKLIPWDSGKEIGLETIEERLKDNIVLLDALGVSGGEPTLQPRQLEDVFSLARKHGLKSFLNTNGSRPEVIEDLVGKGLVDHVALDVKAPLLPHKYCRVIGLESCGAIVKNVRRSLDTCSSKNVSLEIRTTIVPGLTDEDDFVRMIAKEIGKKSTQYILQQFNPQAELLDPSLKQRGYTPREKLVSLASVALQENLQDVYIKTREEGLEKVK